jgi:hypothetical protein
MGVSFNTYKKSKIQELIKEQLYEIFNTSAMSVNLEPKQDNHRGFHVPTFEDTQGNKINILYHYDDNDVYELDFTINGDSFQNTKVFYSIQEYAKLLATIAQSVDIFLDEIQPVGLILDGADSPKLAAKNPKKIGQKNRIYSYFISAMKDREDYKLEKTRHGGFNLIKK